MKNPDEIFTILFKAHKRYKEIQKVQKPLQKVKKISETKPKDYASIRNILVGANKEVKQFIKFLDGHASFLNKTLTQVKFVPVPKPDSKHWYKYVELNEKYGADDKRTRKMLSDVIMMMTKYDERLANAKARAINECEVHLANAKTALTARKGVEQMVKGLKLMVAVSKNDTAAVKPMSLAIDLEPATGRFTSIAKAHMKIHERVWEFSQLCDKELKDNRYWLNELRKVAAKQMASDAAKAAGAIGKNLKKIFA